MGVAHRQFTDQIVRMLAVNERTALIAFAGLKQQGISRSTRYQRVQREHAAKTEQAFLPNRPLAHKHDPVGCIKLFAAPAAFVQKILLVVAQEKISVQHVHPFRAMKHIPIHG